MARSRAPTVMATARHVFETEADACSGRALAHVGKGWQPCMCGREGFECVDPGNPGDGCQPTDCEDIAEGGAIMCADGSAATSCEQA